MALEAVWRDLHKTDDLLKGRAIATAIAAMDYDVRLTAAGAGLDDDVILLDEQPTATNFPGPDVVQVPDEHWLPLHSALDDIIREQLEFDTALEASKHAPPMNLKLVGGVFCVVIMGYVLYRMILQGE